jgi:hypothetical protein
MGASAVLKKSSMIELLKLLSILSMCTAQLGQVTPSQEVLPGRRTTLRKKVLNRRRNTVISRALLL